MKPGKRLIGLLALTLAFTGCGGSAESADANRQSAGKTESATADVVQLSKDASVDLKVQSLDRKRYPRRVTAPGEVKLNAYASAQVTPRIAAQVVARHARLGEKVDQGQSLVTLSSIEVANAEGALVEAARNWSRLRRLGKGVVGEKRYVAARVAYRNARAALAAYGLSKAKIDAVEAQSDTDTRGRFDLLAPLNGSVLRDEFVVGEYVNAGSELFLVADLDTLWVEAELSPATARTIEIGSQARIKAADVDTTGRVVLKQPSAQASTRTVGVRIQVDVDSEHSLYPGDFVQATLMAGMTAPVMAVPEAALVSLPDGAWAVFVRVGDRRFREQQVKLGERLAGVTVIDGIAPGTDVAMQGAFFLASELGKASLGDD